jgi:aminopeptidase N
VLASGGVRLLSRGLGLAASLLLAAPVLRADTYPRQPGVDVEHYAFRLSLRDDTDEIAGEAAVTIRARAGDAGELLLDLAAATPARAGKGMQVEAVSVDGAPAAWAHEGDRLRVAFPAAVAVGEARTVAVRYRGTPAGGLRIGPNKHAERTFFSDNWPDRARQWLPTVDHPHDKATVEMIVEAPAHYQVVSNGLLVEETDLPAGLRRTHWRQGVPLASWLYVLGVARFAVQHLGETRGVPVQTWVYARDREAGFFDFAVPTREALEYYAERVGPYAYEKLASVQSASVRGGMEAATAIFYGEDAVTGTRAPRWQNVIVHEIAHQWFGNAVTESDWDDVWLSEGFATYFTLLFVEHARGREAFREGLARSRQTVLDFEEKNPGYRIVHDRLHDMSKVTSSHTYQKGAWVLHMLRGLVGTEAFWRGVREYYRRHRDGNATTVDFRRAMEEASGLPLGPFFRQWLERGGIPRLAGRWTWDARARRVTLDLEQTQPGEPFRLAVEVGVEEPGQPPRRERVELAERRQRFTLAAGQAPSSIRLDPEGWLLLVEADLRPR